MKILSYRRFALWWQLAQQWLAQQFAAIISNQSVEVDLTGLAKTTDLAPLATATDVQTKFAALDGKLDELLARPASPQIDTATDDEIDEMMEEVMA